MMSWLRAGPLQPRGLASAAIMNATSNSRDDDEDAQQQR